MKKPEREADSAKVSKPGKVPKLFRRPIPEKKFQRKILKRIFVTKEREFLLGLMKQDTEGRYILAKELSKADAKRLKALAASIKKNKGLVTGWKAGILLFIIGAVLVFNLVFKNSLAERGMESALQSLFQARADVEGTRVSLFRGQLAFDSLAVADREKPMRNLFELKETELRVNIWELLKKRLVIERAAATGIALDTPREVSGALEGAESADADAPESADVPSGLETLAGEADPEAIFAAQRSRITSPAYIEQVNGEYRQALEKWPVEIDSLGGEIEEARKAAGRIAAVDAASVDTLEEAAAALRLIEENVGPVREAASSAERTAREFNRDRQRLDALRQDIGEALEADYALLESVVADPGGELTGIAGQAAENILRARAGSYYDRLRKLLDAAGKLSSDNEKREESSGLARRGAVVSFPTVGYPRFLVREFHLSAGTSGTDPYVDLRAGDFSSQPDLWPRPATFSFDLLSGGLGLQGDGLLDLRSSAETLLALDGTLEGGGFDAGDRFAYLGIENLESATDGTLGLSVDADGNGRGSAEIRLVEMEYQFDGSDDPLKEALREILIDTTEAVFTVGFGLREGRLTDFTVRSDLDRIIAQRVGAYLERRAQELTEELKERLRDEVASSLADNSRLEGLLGAYGGDLAGSVREADSLEDLIGKQREELEARIEEIRNEAAADVRKEAENLLEDAGKKLKLPF
jgi:uncharacterized protein (TIGR03545 family)